MHLASQDWERVCWRHVTGQVICDDDDVSAVNVSDYYITYAYASLRELDTCSC